MCITHMEAYYYSWTNDAQEREILSACLLHVVNHVVKYVRASAIPLHAIYPC